VTKGTLALRDVVNALAQLTDEQGAFLNPSTGEIVILSNDELYVVEREEDASNFPELSPERIGQARAVIESDDFSLLPTRFDLNEHRIAQDFCASVMDESLRRHLLDAMAAEESAQRFPDMLRSHGLEERWRQFRTKALEALAGTWLEKNGLAPTRDEPAAP
jgi:hypothetical protein